MSIDWNAVAHEWHNKQPHPKAPSITVGEFPIATKLATVLKFGQGHASPQEASNFWKEFQAMNERLQNQKKAPMSPEEFTHLAKQTAQVSFAYHGRPPSMYEMQRLRDAHPKDAADYYASLPDEHYPHVPAGKMVQALQSAKPAANQIIGRDPNKGEAAYLVHSGENPRNFYKRMKQGAQDTAGPHSGVVGAGAGGGQQDDQRTADPRLAAGSAAAGGPEGVPQG